MKFTCTYIYNVFRKYNQVSPTNHSFVLAWYTIIQHIFHLETHSAELCLITAQVVDLMLQK